MIPLRELAVPDQARVRHAYDELVRKIDQKSTSLGRIVRAARPALPATWEGHVKQLEALLGRADPMVAWEARQLAEEIASRAPAAAERARALRALIGLLAQDFMPRRGLLDVIAKLTTRQEDEARIRRVLLDLLAREHEPVACMELADAVTRFGATAADLELVRRALLGLLTSSMAGRSAARLADALPRFGATSHELDLVRQALVSLLRRERNPPAAAALGGCGCRAESDRS